MHIPVVGSWKNPGEQEEQLETYLPVQVAQDSSHKEQI